MSEPPRQSGAGARAPVAAGTCPAPDVSPEHGHRTLTDRRQQFRWSKGGGLRGESPARLAFLRRIIEEAPLARLQVVRPTWGPCHLATADGYRLHCWGTEREAGLGLFDAV